MDVDVNSENINGIGNNQMELSLQMSGSEDENRNDNIDNNLGNAGNIKSKEINSNGNMSQITNGLGSNVDKFGNINVDNVIDSLANENSKESLMKKDEMETVSSINLSHENGDSNSVPEDNFLKNRQKRTNIIDSDSDEDSACISNKLKSSELTEDNSNSSLVDVKNVSQPVNSDSEDVALFEKRTKRASKKKVMLDSDDSGMEERTKVAEEPEKDDSDGSNRNEKKSPKVKSLSRIKGLIDSDSSDDNDDQRSAGSSPKNAATRQLFNSDDEDVEDIFNVEKDKKKRRNKKSGKRVRAFDLANEMENDTSKSKKSSQKKTDSLTHKSNSDSISNVKKLSTISNLIDSESEEEQRSPKKTQYSDPEDITALSGDETKGKKKSKKKTDQKPDKKMDLQSIRSETQRLMREKYVTLPYHKPKQRSLDEFLSRKIKIDSVPNAPTIAAKLQMYSDRIGQIAEEKEKDAELFFCSSDSEDENDDPDYNPDENADLTENKDTTESVPNDLTDNIHTPNPELAPEPNIDLTEETSVDFFEKPSVDVSRKLSFDSPEKSFDLTESSVDPPEKPSVDLTEESSVDPPEKPVDLSEEMSIDLPEKLSVDVSEEMSVDPPEKSSVDLSEEMSVDLPEPPSETKTSSSKPTIISDEIVSTKYILKPLVTDAEPIPSEEKSIQDDSMESQKDEEQPDRDNIKWTEDESFVIESEKSTNDETEIEKLSLVPDNYQNSNKPHEKDSQSIVLHLDTFPDSVPISDEMSEPSVEQPKKRLSIREMLRKSVGNFVPKLSGSPNSTIDLSLEDEKEYGVNHLKTRFLQHSVPKKKSKPVVQNSDNDVVLLADEDDNPKLKKAGAKRAMLQECLKQTIQSQRLEEWKKKEEEEKELNKKTKDVEGNKEEDGINAILDLEDEEDMEDEEESEEEEDEELYLVKEKKRKKCAFADDEAEVSEDEVEEREDEEEGDGEDENGEEDEDEDVKPRKLKRIVKAFEDDDSNSSTEDKNEEETGNMKRIDTSADMFSHTSLTNESNEFEPVYQQPRSSSDENSRSNDGFVKNDAGDKKDDRIVGQNKFESSEATTQEANFSSFADSPMLFQKTKPRVTNAGITSWLQKQTKLFEPPSDSVKEDELLDICSGRFDDDSQLPITQRESPVFMDDHITSKLNSSKPTFSGLIGKTYPEQVTDTQLQEICSGKFESQPSISTDDKPKNQLMFGDETSQDIRLTLEEESPTKNKIDESPAETKVLPKTTFDPSPSETSKKQKIDFASSDEEEDDFAKKSKKKVSKAKPLVFSDDENNDSSGEESDIEPEENEEEKYIDYDSEENEVVVVPAKNIRKEARKFVENEAELSESDWGSEDEDEKGLDRLELEEGDKDDIDDDEVRDQLGKIHMKKILDEDQRDVKMLQELLFEEGDLHSDGAGRERRFKWKNNDTFFVDENKVLDENGVMFDDEEDENESQLRKQRFEQEKILAQLKEGKEDDLESDFNDSQLFQIGFKVATKSVKTVNTTETEQTVTKKTTSVSETTLMPGMLSHIRGMMSKNSILHKKTVKGSFLTRQPDDLKRIANTLKNEKDLVFGKQNFAFQHLSPSVKNKDKEEEDDDDDEEKEKEEQVKSQNRKRKSGPDSTPVGAKRKKTSDTAMGKRLFSQK